MNFDLTAARASRKTFTVFLTFYMLVFGGNAIFTAFLPVFLDESGLNKAQIGIVLAAGPLVAIFAQPLWGLAADRSRYKNTIMKVIVGTCSAISLLFLIRTDFYYIMAIYSFFMVFYSSVFSTNDSITLESIAGSGLRFGLIRFGGTIGFSVIVVITGFLAKLGSKTMFPLYSLVAVLTLALAFAVPKVRGHQSDRAGNGVPFRQLFKYHELMLLIAFNFVIQTSLGFYYSFFPIYFKKMDGDSSLLGIAMMLAAVSETPFLFFADRIIKKIGVKTMLMLSGLAAVLRWGLFSVVDNVFGIMAIQVLHGVMFVALTLTLAVYINENVEKKLKASGHTLNTISGMWLSKIAGSLIGGAASQVLELKWIFAISSLVCAAAVAVFFLLRNKFKNIAVRPEDA